MSLLSELRRTGGEREGYWPFAMRRQRFTAVWTRLVTAHIRGELGTRLRISTNKRWDCVFVEVYTKDWDDVDDARRVRQALYDLGVDWNIHYQFERPRHDRAADDFGDPKLVRPKRVTVKANRFVEAHGWEEYARKQRVRLEANRKRRAAAKAARVIAPDSTAHL